MSRILLKNIAVEGIASDILIEDGIIASVHSAGGQAFTDDGQTEVADCTGKAAMPGFVNMHTHAGMAMMRGIGEDMSFPAWPI